MKQEIYNIIARGKKTMEKDRKRWMKPKEAADYLSVHLETIYRMISMH
jgi:hypothetical protein